MIHAPGRGFEQAWSDLKRRVRALERGATGIGASGSTTITITETGGGGTGGSGVTVVEGPDAPSSPTPGTIWIKT